MEQEQQTAANDLHMVVLVHSVSSAEVLSPARREVFIRRLAGTAVGRMSEHKIVVDHQGVYSRGQALNLILYCAESSRIPGTSGYDDVGLLEEHAIS
jgi:hypothetical protein